MEKLNGAGNSRSYILLDVGGTQIKAGILCGAEEGPDGIFYYPSLAKEDGEVILDHFAHVIKELMARRKGVETAGIGMAFPGPFDYGRGISLMKGLDKYDGIYGVSIADELRKRVASLCNVRFCFLHDVEAFALGESWFGEARGAGKLLCLCIGTGAGSAFIKDRKALKAPEDGVPANGWLYNTPYKDSVIDDYISARGLKKISARLLGEELDGKELYERCRQKDERALGVYREFGRDLEESMRPFLERFRPDCVVLGGQISKSFPYFGGSLRETCGNLGIAVCLEPETSVRALQGLFVAMEQEGYDVKS